MKKEEKFVLELPLKVEKWESDLLNKRYEYLRQIYNYAQSKLLRQFRYFEQMSEWKKCKSKIDKQTFLETHPFRIKGFDKKIIFSKFKPKRIEEDLYGITNFVEQICKKKVSKDFSYKDFGINTTNINAIGNNIWAAWNKKLYGAPKCKKDKKTGIIKKIPNSINFKKYGDLNTINIRCKNGSFCGLKVELNNQAICLYLNIKSKENKKEIRLPVDVKKFTEYELNALKGGIESISVITIVRKIIRGKYKYYVQFCIDKKFRPQKQRKLGCGEVGIDVGPSTVAISSVNGVRIDLLAADCDKIEHKCTLLQRKMDRSKRTNNVENYNDNGTIKKGKLSWKFSKRYIKTRLKKRELQRKQAAIRNMLHNILANEYLKYGNDFRVENNPYSAWSRRSIKPIIDEKGKYKSKKRFGKSIANHAPSMFISKLKDRVLSLGGNFVEVDIKNAASRFDFTNNTFSEHKLKERKITLSNGDTHQRDMLAAFNLQHSIYDGEDLKKYDIEEMNKDYSIFCRLEQEEINRYIKKEKVGCKSTIEY